jgi:hypothetical protein
MEAPIIDRRETAAFVTGKIFAEPFRITIEQLRTIPGA